jgi:hypothetical protein
MTRDQAQAHVNTLLRRVEQLRELADEIEAQADELADLWDLPLPDGRRPSETDE